MSKNIKFAIILTLVFLLGTFAFLIYFQMKEAKQRAIDSASATRAELDVQQSKINELQSFRDEQVRIAEEERRIAEQREQEKAEASKSNSEQNATRDCEDTKRYCSEEIKNRKISIDDITKQVKNDQNSIEAGEDECKKAKADGESGDFQIKMACAGTLPNESMLKEEKKNLADQERELANLLKGKCLNYKVACQ